MELREFTKTDWYGFAGAMRWDDSEPLLAEGTFEDGMLWVLVLDRNGGCLICDDERAQYGGYMLDRRLETVGAARLFAELLGKPRGRFDFFKAGFKAI